MVWPTLGSRMAKEQNRTVQLISYNTIFTDNTRRGSRTCFYMLHVMLQSIYFSMPTFKCRNTQSRQMDIFFIFQPTSKKPQAEKLGQTYKIMVATAIYSVTMVLWKETAFPVCGAMERSWKRNVVSRVSSVIVVIRLPISCVSSMAISCHVPCNGYLLFWSFKSP